MDTKTIQPNIQIEYDAQGFSTAYMVELYKKLLYPRLIEEKMLKLLRQGKITKWFSGIGQEAISIAATEVMEKDEYIFPMHRNLGVFTNRGIPLEKLIAQWQGKEGSFTKGRDRSFHFGAPEYGVIGMISHLGPQLSLADGTALAHKLKDEQKLSIAFTGEGGTSEGEFHEALNVAAVWSLPVLFIVENNGYGLSTPIYEQYNCNNIADKAIGYGMESAILDGNNILELVSELRKIAEDIRRNPRPFLIECKTFRMRGHEEASGTKYISPELFEIWKKKDPVVCYRNYLHAQGILTEVEVAEINAAFHKQIEDAVHTGFSAPEIPVDTRIEYNDVYKQRNTESINVGTPFAEAEIKEMRFIDAISHGLKEAMFHHDNLILMGQDIAEYGGAFKITKGLVEEFGRERVRNTPLCESAIIGVGLGLSLKNYKAVVEMQFADFVSCGFNQIVNNLAKLHYRWGGPADVVVRMPTGGGVAAGPFHSQSTEAWFTHVPGLKVYYPSNPQDARDMLLAAIEDPNPVLYFEHKKLYRSIKGHVNPDNKSIDVESAQIVHPGKNATIVTYGMGVHWAMEEIQAHNYSIEVIDLRSLAPIDYETILKSIEKTNKVLILHEANMTGGIGGEISAYLGENAFEILDAPIMRVGSLDTPIPFNAELEKNYLASSRLHEAIEKLIKY